MKIDPMNKLVGIILAGGKGTRFEGVGGNVPKSMSKVGLKNKPHLEYLVEYLLRKGLKKIIIVAGFLSPLIQEKFLSWKKRGVEVILDPPEIPDTGGATKNALLYLLKGKEYFRDILYWSPDTLVTGVDPRILYRYHLSHGLPSTIVFTNDPTAPNTGKVGVNRKGNFLFISHFNESGERVFWKNSIAHAGCGIIKISTLLDIFYLPPLEKKNAFCMYRKVIPLVVDRGAAAWITSDQFLEWGTAGRFDEIILRNPHWIEGAYV